MCLYANGSVCLVGGTRLITLDLRTLYCVCGQDHGTSLVKHVAFVLINMLTRYLDPVHTRESITVLFVHQSREVHVC